MKSERQTRQEKIDLQLGRAGWSSGSRQLISELLVENPGGIRNEPDTFRAQNEFVDYALFDRLGRLLAIVEAKRSSRDPLVGERTVVGGILEAISARCLLADMASANSSDSVRRILAILSPKSKSHSFRGSLTRESENTILPSPNSGVGVPRIAHADGAGAIAATFVGPAPRNTQHRRPVEATIFRKWMSEGQMVCSPAPAPDSQPPLRRHRSPHARVSRKNETSHLKNTRLTSPIHRSFFLS